MTTNNKNGLKRTVKNAQAVLSDIKEGLRVVNLIATRYDAPKSGVNPDGTAWQTKPKFIFKFMDIKTKDISEWEFMFDPDNYDIESDSYFPSEDKEEILCKVFGSIKEQFGEFPETDSWLDMCDVLIDQQRPIRCVVSNVASTYGTKIFKNFEFRQEFIDVMSQIHAQ